MSAEATTTPTVNAGSRIMQLNVPRTVLYGRGAADAVTEHIGAAGRRRPFVITDRNLVEAGVGERLRAALSEGGAGEIYAREPGEPKASHIEAIAEDARAFEPSAIIAIGGGATIDASRCVRGLVALGGTLAELRGGEAIVGPLEVPFVAVATTSGTGSESAIAALYTDDATREKRVFFSPHLRADVAVVDPDLTLTVPPGPTRATGMDALAQGAGAFLSPFAHPITDALAANAVRLLAANVVRVVERGDDIEARCAMAHGSLMSGLAMNNADAMADQFFDEVMGPRYGIPHGIVAGIFLPFVVQFNRAVAEEKIGLLARELGGPADGTSRALADFVVSRFAQISEDVGLPTLASLGVPRADIPKLAKQVAGHFGVEAGCNPRHITTADAQMLLEAAFDEHHPLSVA